MKIHHWKAAYTGIGARNTPRGVLQYMYEQARMLESMGMFLRTGDAKGADEAFRAGAQHKLVYGAEQHIHDWAYHKAQALCPVDFTELKPYVQHLLARNMYQVFGNGASQDAKPKSLFVLYWSLPAPEFSKGWNNNNYYNCSGGTSYAVRAACDASIPTFNLYNQKKQWETYRDGGFNRLDSLAVTNDVEGSQYAEPKAQPAQQASKPTKQLNAFGICPKEFRQFLNNKKNN